MFSLALKYSLKFYNNPSVRDRCLKINLFQGFCLKIGADGKKAHKPQNLFSLFLEEKKGTEFQYFPKDKF